MARKKLTDGEIITALMASHTITEAGKLLNVSRQTIYNRLKDPEFDIQLKAAQVEREKQLENLRESATVDALECLRRILTDRSFWTSANDRDKIAAARTVLEFIGS